MCWPGCWCPRHDADGSIASKALTDRRGIALTAGLGSLLVVVLLLASVLGAGWLASLAWPLVISLTGAVLIWRNAPADEQATMRRLAQPLLSAWPATAGSSNESGPGPCSAWRSWSCCWSSA